MKKLNTYGLWSVVLREMSPVKLAVFLDFQPILAATIAWIWIGEVPTIYTYVGGFVAIVGVYIVQQFGDKRSADRPSLLTAEIQET